MASEDGFQFICPNCNYDRAGIEEAGRTLRAGQTYTATCCGAPVVLVALSIDNIMDPKTIRWSRIAAD